MLDAAQKFKLTEEELLQIKTFKIYSLNGKLEINLTIKDKEVTITVDPFVKEEKNIYICEAALPEKVCEIDKQGFGSCGNWNRDGRCLLCRIEPVDKNLNE